MGNEDTRRGTRSNEYTLPPGTYIYVQDGTSGKIKTYVGPTVVTLTGNDSPIVFELVKGSAEFRRCESLHEAVRKSIVAPDGFYAVLMNPAKGSVHPVDGEVKPAPDLEVGSKVVVTGPRMFALWPGQSAKVVRGHHLRSNQYLLCRVYNEDEARRNWGKAKMVKAVTSTEPAGGAGQGDENKPAPQPPIESAQVPAKLTVGQLLIIRGTEVSFYIPPTGITVVADENGEYVREAITLEQLQYCILLDENGRKRYVHGPEVVFPEPTESFVKDGENNAIFRAIELNEIQGIHIKITRSYTDPVLGEKKEGEEIFVTGKEYPIYFPREEHAVVKYDGKTKHFAVAVPEGEARYVMNRLTGEVKLVNGPRMLLPNPVTEVIVRRALTEKECHLWYPGNGEVMAYNQALNEVAKNAPTTRAGAVSEGDFERASKRRGMEGLLAGQSTPDVMYAAASHLTSRGTPSKKSMMDVSSVSNAASQAMGDEISRASTFTQPRTVTLNTKFEGAPKIVVWTGFAVMIVNSKGERRVVEGPANVLLAYDETLESMSLSTGKPKTTDHLIQTPYLRTKNNKVADIVQVETADHVLVDIKLSYLVNFTGDSKKWWDVENYVKFLCDHMRSKLKGTAKALKIDDLYANPLNFVRSVVLMQIDEPGAPDPTVFEENGMVVTDVEVLSAKITDETVARLLIDSQKSAVQRSITLADLRRNLDATKERERITIEEAQVKFTTETKKRELEKQALTDRLAVKLIEIAGAIEEAQRRVLLRKSEEDLLMVGHESSLARSKAQYELDNAQEAEQQKLKLAEMAAEADAIVKRFGALSGGLSEALLTLSSQRTLADVAQALSVQKLLGGQNAVDVLGKMFDGTPLGGLMESIAKKAGALPNGNGDHKQLAEVTS